MKTTAVDEKTLRDWYPKNATKTQTRPSFEALGLVFKDDKELTTIILNFAFARLLEQLTATLAQSAPKKEANAFYLNLKAQAKSLDPIYALSRDNLDWEEYIELALSKQKEHEALIDQFAEFDEIGISHPAVDHLKCYKEYAMNYLQTKPMSGWESFSAEDRFLLQLSTLADPNLVTHHNQITQRLKRLKQDQPKWSKALAGPLHRIDARLKLVDTKLKPAKRIEAAMRSYRKSVETSIYAAGDETSTIISEAMGFAAFVYRRELKCGTQKTGYLLPFLRKCFNYRMLLGENLCAFDNDQEEQQYYERMEQWFIEYLSPQLRKQLEGDIRNLEFTRTDFSSAVHFSDFETIDKLRSEPLSKRQKKPFSKTITSSEQTPLMEAIDREQLEYAHELVETELNLNFINSTGDTAVTKAFAQKDYPLVHKILQREDDPISVETLLHLTEKLQNSSLRLTLSEGRVEILRELYQPSHSGRQPMNMDQLIAGSQTPLYYAVQCLGAMSLDTEAPDFLEKMVTGLPQTHAMQKLLPNLQSMTPGELEIMKEVSKYYQSEANITGIHECIDYLINECQVKLDTPNRYDHSALTVAAEFGMQDIVAKLLAAGANANHRFQGGGTAICWAIKNNDLEMVNLLLEYEADTSFFVEGLGHHIHQLPMSDKIRRLIPSKH
ncbi:ankyrin repeat domain-containing protein [Coraliomargarita sp. SDUM461004]|uniref:Ankyrin repeat domain-containing protein n=1 Tax=Thalassobacterium sedimentorum TaxID=3041258 RepID=A0ABU1AH48_9BACT|nr:ankyrin repeat domain-containing protein [Coraliomargarita sp. SDUM461004]MDQ8194032.1 ankyrin repeat domain-containing protein [Coraliomargarita sp. SDUM461004]